MTLEHWLTRACAGLGLRAEIGFIAELPNAAQVRSVARIVGLGAPNGMLIFRRFDTVRPYVSELDESGFGFAVLDEPRLADGVDLDAAREMFADWGWSGDEADRPGWLKDPTCE